MNQIRQIHSTGMYKTSTNIQISVGVMTKYWIYLVEFGLRASHILLLLAKDATNFKEGLNVTSKSLLQCPFPWLFHVIYMKANFTLLLSSSAEQNIHNTRTLRSQAYQTVSFSIILVWCNLMIANLMKFEICQRQRSNRPHCQSVAEAIHYRPIPSLFKQS